MDTADILLRAALVGIGGTIVLDLYAFLMERMFGVAANWKMVGRWLGHMSKCEFVQTNIGQTACCSSRSGVQDGCVSLGLPSR